MKVLVTGATGYIGGRLVPRLLEAGHSVRVMVRDAARVAGRPWAEGVEVAVADVEDEPSLEKAVAGCDAAYYLIHSMDAGADFARRDREAAQAFVRVGGHLQRVIYLGGLVPDAEDLSTHLASRAEVGEILREGLPTVEFRAGPVIGSGSASFEMVRYLTERLPAMIAPRWILNEVQPIAVRDVLAYLEAGLTGGELGIYSVGTDALTFKGMMLGFARVRGLTRIIVPVPVLAPGLAALWVGFVTPIPNRLAVPLIQGVVHPVVADTSRARLDFPDIKPIGYQEAVARALERTTLGEVDTRWSGALGNNTSYEVDVAEGMVREVRRQDSAAPPEAVFRSVASLGGDRGWLVWRWAWALRGMMDRMVGGPGLRRGRRHPTEVLPGDAVDFWRVEAVDAPHRLRLRAEMKVPGRAWLEWEVEPLDGGSRLVQTALFAPIGLTGHLYWNMLYPVHRFIFSDMVAAIVRDAETGRLP
jgi:uncharacterized protein YbjT (DUF2867 family)